MHPLSCYNGYMLTSVRAAFPPHGMRKLFIFTMLFFGVCILWQMITTPRMVSAQTEIESHKQRIIELQSLWQKSESEQQSFHFEAEKNRRALCNLGEKEFCKFEGEPVSISVTPYNPEVGQTDSSPCIGASGIDLCHLSKTERIAALSQDLVGRAAWKKFRYGDYVYIEGRVSGCTGVFRVEDTMNARYTNYGDIFLMDRSENFGTCVVATVQKLKYNDL